MNESYPCDHTSSRRSVTALINIPVGAPRHSVGRYRSKRSKEPSRAQLQARENVSMPNYRNSTWSTFFFIRAEVNARNRVQICQVLTFPSFCTSLAFRAAKFLNLNSFVDLPHAAAPVREGASRLRVAASRQVWTAQQARDLARAARAFEDPVCGA